NISSNGWGVKFYKPNEDEIYFIAIDPRTNKAASMFFHRLPDTLAVPSVERSEAESIISNTLALQNIDITKLPIHRTWEQKYDFRSDRMIDYKNEISLQNQFMLEEIISTGVGGDKFSYYDRNIKVPGEWKREYMSSNFLFLICTWLPMILLISSILIGLYYLIRNTYVEKYQISWYLIGTTFFSVLFISVTWFINNIPLYKAWYFGGTQSWLVFWLDTIGGNMENIIFLCLLIMIPIS
ncbi:uncharacterized protein METZ01_LOCUS490767, partial [marine metagenome]